MTIAVDLGCKATKQTMDYSEFIVTNQKEESISIQKVKIACDIAFYAIIN